MGLFKKRPDAAALSRARQALAQEAVTLAELAATRAQRLLDDEDVAAVAEIDRRIEQHRLTAAALRDRIPLLEADLHQQAVEALELRRQAIVARIADGLHLRDVLAAQLDGAVARVAELYIAIHANIEQSRAKWPFPTSPTAGWSDDCLAGEVLGALQAQTRAVGGLFPRRVWGALATLLCHDGIKTRVLRHSANLLRSLHNAPLPDPQSDDEDQESEAA